MDANEPTLAPGGAGNDGTTPPPAPTVPGPPVEHRFEFCGSGSEYFRIWIVNLALSIVTIGIYSAWAKVRRLKYMHGATSLDGSAFGYHGDPKKILKGRLIGAGLFALYSLAGRIHPYAGLVAFVLLMAAIPWLIVRSMMFRTRMTSWRGLRFNFDENYRGAYATYFGWLLLTVVTFGLAFPQYLRKLYLYLVNDTRVGDTPMKCTAPLGPFYIGALQAFGLIAVIGVAAAILLPAAGLKAGADPNLVLIVGFYIVFLLLYALAAGLFQAKVLNTVFSHSTIGPHELRSELKGSRLGWLYATNLLGILCTLGLFIPWATIRLLRYRMESLTLVAHGSLDDFIASQPQAQTSAVGEEVSDIFDVDFGL